MKRVKFRRKSCIIPRGVLYFLLQNSQEAAMDKIVVSICMGSSCFSRGSKTNLDVIREYLALKGVEDRVELSGSLCQGKCSEGPNLVIDGVPYPEADPASVRALLDKALGL